MSGNYSDQIAEAMRLERAFNVAHPGLPGSRALINKTYALRRQAAHAFAALNGWRVTSVFPVKTLVRGGIHAARNEPHWLDHDYDLFDHPIYFREAQRPYRTAAIVGQPYGTSPEDACSRAFDLSLETHDAPNLTASWWFPGQTRFYCFTRPGTQVWFLPEQI